jgi:hypothetical protein
MVKLNFWLARPEWDTCADSALVGYSNGHGPGLTSTGL